MPGSRDAPTVTVVASRSAGGAADAMIHLGRRASVLRVAEGLQVSHSMPASGIRILPVAGTSTWATLAPTDDDDASAMIRAVRAAVAAQPVVSHLQVELLEPTPPDVVRLVVEAILIALPRTRAGAGELPVRLTVIAPEVSEADAGAAADRARVTAGAVRWARAEVDEPANRQSPEALAASVSSAVRRLDRRHLACEVIEPTLDQWPALVAVSGGSDRPPRVVRMVLDAGSGRHIALVGKGVTFDAGGLDIKPPEQMSNMRRDMAGAASVAAAVLAAAELGLQISVEATLVLTDNTIGGSALRPGDIIEHRDRSTTEVTDTDSEGRLILADAYLDARGRSPRCIVDAATLTGGGGLGPDRWAVLGSDQELVTSLLAAGDDADEPGWQLPLLPAYRRFLDTPFADRCNYAGEFRYGFDTLLAACFLADFAADVPFAHLDVSAVAARDSSTSEPGRAAGATGIPTRALVRWLEDAATPQPPSSSSRR